MRKINPTLPMKGIRTPRFLIWFRGYLHGKILHTGGLDPETNVISSGYVTGQIKSFHCACITRCNKAEDHLTDTWVKAEELLIDYASLISALDKSCKNQNTPCDNKSQARANERDAERRASYEADLQNILKNLAKLANKIRQEYATASDQMEATAQVLGSTFACYGHGLLMQPVYPQNLPAIEYQHCAKQILVNHTDTWNAVVSILEEVKKR